MTAVTAHSSSRVESASMAEAREIAAAAATIGLTIEARRTQDLEPAFAKLAAGEAGALLVTADPFLEGEREVVAQMVAEHALAAISPTREYVEAGGLITYGTSIADAHRQAGGYVARILKGTSPPICRCCKARNSSSSST